MKVLIAGGGTGGHVYPAIAVANELKHRHPDWQIEFIGRDDSIEGKVVREAGYSLNSIDVKGYERFYSLRRKLQVGINLLVSMKECMQLFKVYKPDIVIGTGGYVCGPAVLCASMKKIKTLIAEQNVIPGFTIKTLSAFANRVCVSFEESIPFMKKTDVCCVTGNPVRREFELYNREISRKSLNLDENAKMILVFGGSLGAKSINEASVGFIESILDDKNTALYLITGDYSYNSVIDLLKEKGIDAGKHPNIHILPYSNEMPMYMNAADIVVSRSGATTIAEVNYVGIAAVYIPFPHAANDHQTKNALATCNRNASVLITDGELSGDVLTDKLKYLLNNPSVVKTMSQNSRSMGVRNSAQLVSEEVEKLLADK